MVSEKLKSIQQRLSVPKNQYNSFGKYNYRSLEDILEAVKPLLNELNLVLTLTDDMVLIGSRYYVKATAELTDLEDGSTATGTAWAREPEEKKGNDESQITGAASTYARKYALNGLFCLDDTRDPDSMDNGSKEAQRGSKQQETSKAQANTQRNAQSNTQNNSRGSQVDTNRVTATEEHITKDQADTIRDNLRRYQSLGIKEESILNAYRIKHIEEMTPEMFAHCMNQFEKKYEPMYQEMFMIPDDAPDGGLPWN